MNPPAPTIKIFLSLIIKYSFVNLLFDKNQFISQTDHKIFFYCRIIFLDS